MFATIGGKMFEFFGGFVFGTLFGIWWMIRDNDEDDNDDDEDEGYNYR